MADLVSPCPSWSQRRSSPLPPTPQKSASKASSPIPIPRRRTVLPPPCSPTRDQDSPELVFNFDFSVSPDAPDTTTHLLLQQRGTAVRRFPLQQKATYAPLSALGINQQISAHPYAHEPFLYTVPKLPLRNTRNAHTSVYADPGVDSVISKEHGIIGPMLDSVSANASFSSLSSFQSSDPSCPPSADASMRLVGDENDENFPLTSAFQKPLVSASMTSSMSSFQDAPLSLSSPYRSPSPSPPRHVSSRARTRHMVPFKPSALQQTTAAAPVVSFNVAQAERSDRSLGTRRRSRSRSPLSGIISPRIRRSSSVGAEHDVEKVRDPDRRMATVVGRGAGRVVSMFECSYGGGRSLVSDEDIERSLEKEQAEEARESHRRRRVGDREKGDMMGSPELERGRVRGRPSVRGGGAACGTRTHILPGWQYIDAQ